MTTGIAIAFAFAVAVDIATGRSELNLPPLGISSLAALSNPYWLEPDSTELHTKPTSYILYGGQTKGKTCNVVKHKHYFI